MVLNKTVLIISSSLSVADPIEKSVSPKLAPNHLQKLTPKALKKPETVSTYLYIFCFMCITR